MNVELIPLLELARELYAVPHGRKRFEQYLRTMINERRDELRLAPLVIMNPMAREHVTALIGNLLAIEAEGVAADAIRAALPSLAETPGDFRLGLVVADDARGGWTNRYDYEYCLRFAERPAAQHDWLAGVLWSSEPASAQAVREAALTAVFRAAYVARHGVAGDLEQMLRQEGTVMMQAGCRGPVLDDDDLAYTRELLAPHLQSTGKRIAIECLFGDLAARSLGLTPRGLSLWAGLALALHDAGGRA